MSLKAIIRDSRGFILVVKEYNSDTWNLPGGGIDHDETASGCLLRELKEEVDYNGAIIRSNMIGLETKYLPSKKAVLMWIVYELELEQCDFSATEYTNEVDFVNPKSFKDSKVWEELTIYKLCARR